MSDYAKKSMRGPMRRILLIICTLFLNYSYPVYPTGKMESDAEFIRLHEASQEIKKALEKHTDFFVEVNNTFQNRKARRRFKSLAWWFEELPDYFVKRGSGRVWGREVIMRCIEEHNLNHFTVPRKYFYHIPGTGFALNDNNYWVVAQLIKRSEDFKPFNLEEAIQLCVLLKNTGFSDFLNRNIIRQPDGKIAIIDTESMWVNPKLSCAGIEGLFLRKSFNFNKWFTKDALKYCLKELSKCSQITKETYLRVLKRLDSQERPLRWDYVSYFKDLHPEFAE